MRFVLVVLNLFFLVIPGCKREEVFPSLGMSIAGPIDVAVSANGAYFYVLNVDFDRTYNEGSVLVLNSEGEKITAVAVPRLGRSLDVAGNDMLVSIDRQDGKNEVAPQLLLFDISDPAAPLLKKQFGLDCSGPVNTVMRESLGKTYKYFALTCFDGSLFVGTFAKDRSQSTLKKVRNYGRTRRALILDDKRELLLGFTTEFGAQKSKDIFLYDAKAYDKDGNITAEEPNEIPDDKEASQRARSSKSSRWTYQFFVYDLKAQAQPAPGCAPTADDDCTFPYLEVPSPKVDPELRWLYFNLTNFDGTPDPDADKFYLNPDYKYYRTNFWDAKPDPLDRNVFYLSHRGPPTRQGSPHANQVVKATIVGDLRPSRAGLAPYTDQIITFERVYGFKGAEVSKLHYPGDIEVAEVQGQKLLLVNHFRDLDNWNRGDVYFSVAAKLLDDSMWSTETAENTNPGVSWFQIAINRQGRAISGSFYGNKVILLDVTPGVDIREFKRIE